MKIDDKLLSYLEDLSCLTLTASEKSQLSDDFGKILEYMDILGGLDTIDVSEMSHPFPHVNAFRPDTVKESTSRELILKNAPHHNGEIIVAPPTYE
ncbi:MAG: Asp-tRNA(Asn)/Glu-tRNA(Gln) amidotransferase subunit GatC [Lachnospiraceae bacterium]|nr:Asp-tRNA(Asn)/Glu-tRNA(Gln) amidotransferase subunit GatC [Lachnospiraceae bacterium]